MPIYLSRRVVWYGGLALFALVAFCALIEHSAAGVIAIAYVLGMTFLITLRIRKLKERRDHRHSS